MPLVRKSAAPPAAPAEPAADASEALKQLTSGTDDERWLAARALSDLPAAVGQLSSALDSEANPRVREAIMTTLARIGSSESVKAVMRFLRSDDANVRTEALDALVAMKGVVWARVPELLADADADVRILACELTRNMPAPDAISMLSGRLAQETQPNVCAAAVEVLDEIGDATAVPALRLCEQRFHATPFLRFAIGAAIEQVRAQSPEPRD
jgi:HEAT repeat protein